jgi:TonB family protein
MAQIVAPDIISEQGDDIVVDIDDDDYLPSMEEFVAVEIIAEMIHYETPGYPRLAEQAGLEGLVWIKALVTRDGSVRDAVVYKSSGTPSLDDAAVAAAPKCQFKPAIQNGRPVAMWVTYKVEFILNR